MKLSVSAYRAHASAHKKILSSGYHSQLNYGSTGAAASSSTASTAGLYAVGINPWSSVATLDFDPHVYACNDRFLCVPRLKPVKDRFRFHTQWINQNVITATPMWSAPPGLAVRDTTIYASITNAGRSVGMMTSIAMHIHLTVKVQVRGKTFSWYFQICRTT